MNTAYSIGELANQAGVPASTIRYYERRGLLQPGGRSGGNYRVYGPVELARLKFIRAAQRSGFRLEDIRHLLDLREGKADPCGEVQTILEQRLQMVGQELDELGRVHRVLTDALAWCHRADDEGRCVVLDDLDSGASE